MGTLERGGLRKAAEKLEGREWHAGPVLSNGLSTVDDGSEGMFPIRAERWEADFIALANPATILRLLDDLAARDAAADRAIELLSIDREAFVLQGPALIVKRAERARAALVEARGEGE